MANSSKLPQRELMEISPTLEEMDENRVQRLAMFSPKSPLVGLLLTLFFGQIGVGRFYAGSVFRGMVCLILMVAGFSVFVFCPILGVLALSPWAWMMLLDLLSIYGEIKRSNLARMQEVLGIPESAKLKKKMREHIISYWVLWVVLGVLPVFTPVIMGLL